MKLKFIIATAGLIFCASTFAANSDQKAIDTLQKQIVSVQSEMTKALAEQQASTQKAIAALQTQVQQQLAHLQSELNQMQTQLTAEIKQVQSEMQKSGAPVVSATPGPAADTAAAPAKP